MLDMLTEQKIEAKSCLIFEQMKLVGYFCSEVDCFNLVYSLSDQRKTYCGYLCIFHLA